MTFYSDECKSCEHCQIYCPYKKPIKVYQCDCCTEQSTNPGFLRIHDGKEMCLDCVRKELNNEDYEWGDEDEVE